MLMESAIINNTDLLQEENILSEQEEREILDVVDSEFARIFSTYDKEISLVEQSGTESFFP